MPGTLRRVKAEEGVLQWRDHGGIAGVNATAGRTSHQNGGTAKTAKERLIEDALRGREGKKAKTREEEHAEVEETVNRVQAGEVERELW